MSWNEALRADVDPDATGTDMKLLIVYASTEGQTAKIAERMAAVVHGLDHSAELVNVDRLAADFDLHCYDAVVVGASVHMGQHQQSVVNFVKKHLAELQTMPSAFVSVTLSAAQADAAGQRAAEACIDRFLMETDWQPDKTAHFAGALKYSKYGLLKRFIMKRIAKRAGGDTDTSQDYEYTDWNAVVNFTRDFVASWPV